MSSSRRGGNSDDSILAKMDRARGLSSRARMVWLGGAGVVIAGLIGTVGWLVHTNMTTPRVLPAEGAVQAPPPPGSFDMAHEGSAQIINEPQRQDALPPLVTLPRTPLAAQAPIASTQAPAATMPAPPARAPAAVAAPSRAAAPPYSPSHPSSPSLATSKASPPSLATPRAPAPAVARVPAPPPAVATVQAKPAATFTRAAPAPSAAPSPSSPRPPQRVAGVKKAKPAAVAAERPETPPVDLDVALISALVASRHRAEQAACAEGANCPPKP